MHGSCQNVCLVEQHFLYDWALSCMDKLLGFHYALLVADLILFCYERDFMMSLSDDKPSDIIKGF